MLEVVINTPQGRFTAEVNPEEDKLQSYMDNVRTLRWGVKRTYDSKGNPGPSVEVEHFQYADGNHGGTVALFNDCIERPCGSLYNCSVLFMYRGKPLHHAHGINLYDERGYSVIFGRYQWATLEKNEVNDSLQPPHPYVEGEPYTIGSLARGPSQPDSKRVPDTHTTGSPRNQSTRYYAGWFFSRSTSSIPRHLMRYVTDQIGGLQSKTYNSPGRPYHLSTEKGCALWQHDRNYEVDGKDLKPTLFFDGKVRTDRHSAGHDSLARKTIDNSDPPHTGRGLIGYDWEHMSTEELAEAAILLGSPIALRELERIHRQLFNRASYDQYGLKDMWAEGHSDRTAGWSLQEAAYACLAFRAHGLTFMEVRAADTAKRLAEMLADKSLYTAKTGKQPDPSWRWPFILGREVYGNAWNPETALTSMWQIAPIGRACLCWAKIIDDNAVFMELAEQVGEIGLAHYESGEGFYENALLTSERGVTPKDATFRGFWDYETGSSYPAVIGTAMWILPLLAGLFLETKEEKWRTPLLELNEKGLLNFMKLGGQYEYLWHQGYHNISKAIEA